MGDAAGTARPLRSQAEHGVTARTVLASQWVAARPDGDPLIFFRGRTRSRVGS
jgi:hypothetical protein